MMRETGLYALLFIGLVTIAPNASAYDDLKKLKGKLIVHAGDVEAVQCPIGDKYDCVLWPPNLLKFQYTDASCFVSDARACSSFPCEGFIATGKDKVPKFYTVDHSGKIQEHSVKPYVCPDVM
jgi:hypothetical protein